MSEEAPENPPSATSSAFTATSQKQQLSSGCFPRTVQAIASAGTYYHRCQAQLDTGAMLSLVTAKLARAIRAKKLKGTAITIAGVGGEVHSPHEVELQLRSLHSSDSILIRASVVDQIPAYISAGDLSQVKQLPVFWDLMLADPGYTCQSQMEILLGMAHCIQCSMVGTVLSVDKLFKAEKTIFRWAIGGVVSVPATKESMSTCLRMAPVQEIVEQLLQIFWALEEVPREDCSLSKEEQLAITHFRETHRRQPDGRYVVGLPK